MEQGDIVRRLRKAGEVRRAAGMWVVWRAGRSRGVNRPLAAVLCAGRVKYKAGRVLVTEGADRVRAFEAWLLAAKYPLAQLWPQGDAGFLALEMKEAARVLGAIVAQGEQDPPNLPLGGGLIDDREG